MRKERRSYMHRNSVIHAKPGSNNGAFYVFSLYKKVKKNARQIQAPRENSQHYTYKNNIH